MRNPRRPTAKPSWFSLDAVTRRRFLLAAGGSAAGLAFALQRPVNAGVKVQRRKAAYPFTLGVASGDPWTDRALLWTRLAPEPFEPDGGLDPTKVVPVDWEVAEDEQFQNVVRSGTASAHSEYSFSLHVEVTGLSPGRPYWYRFSALGHISEVGRTRTSPDPETMAPLRFGFASCMNFRAGYFQIVQDMADQELDGVFFLGDYIYEYAVQEIPGGRPMPPDLPPEVVPETVTLDQYRLRYALYKSQPELIAAHRNTPWMMLWDDHEVWNDYEADSDAELARQAAAYRAYWEHMPLRMPQRPSGPEGRLYRGLRHGTMARFDLLDARQYRTPQLQPSTIPDSEERRDPDRTILGAEQEEWFPAALANSEARWNIVPQGVLMAVVNTANTTEGPPPPTYASGNWDGYQASQQRLLDAVANAQQTGTVRNFVVLTGDVHCGYASNLLSDTSDLESPSLGTEFTSLSVTSAQDFDPEANERRQIRTVVNPHMDWADLHCGHVVADLQADRMLLDYRVADKVSEADSEVYSLQKFVVEDGVPKVQRA